MLGRRYKLFLLSLLVFQIFFVSQTACLSEYTGDFSTLIFVSVLRTFLGTVIVEYQQGFLNCGEYFAGINSLSACVYIGGQSLVEPNCCVDVLVLLK